MTHVHGGVDLADGLVVRGELVYLHAVAHQLAHDLDFELVQLALGDCVCFGNDGNDVDLRTGREKEKRDCIIIIIYLFIWVETDKKKT